MPESMLLAIRIYAFMITSTLATMGGLMHISRIGAVEAAAGKIIVLSAVAAAVVGGVSLFGGRGKTIQCSHWCHRDFDNR